MTHHLIAERKLGRRLNNEIVRFKDGDKTNFDPSNIEVIQKKTGSLRKRLALVEAKIEELQEERADLLRELGASKV